eukprot:2742957-Amphidinium_carterae.1
MDGLLTTKFPAFLVLIELADKLEELGLDLNLHWVPRDQNIEADALTNGVFYGFDPDKRIHIDPGRLPLRVLPRIAAEASELFVQLRDTRA